MFFLFLKIYRLPSPEFRLPNSDIFTYEVPPVRHESLGMRWLGMIYDMSIVAHSVLGL
jgi:hypothetical protein